jgi:hypothetical protein
VCHIGGSIPFETAVVRFGSPPARRAASCDRCCPVKAPILAPAGCAAAGMCRPRPAATRSGPLPCSTGGTAPQSPLQPTPRSHPNQHIQQPGPRLRRVLSTKTYPFESRQNERQSEGKPRENVGRISSVLDPDCLP